MYKTQTQEKDNIFVKQVKDKWDYKNVQQRLYIQDDRRKFQSAMSLHLSNTTLHSHFNTSIAINWVMDAQYGVCVANIHNYKMMRINDLVHRWIDLY